MHGRTGARVAGLRPPFAGSNPPQLGISGRLFGALVAEPARFRLSPAHQRTIFHAALHQETNENQTTAYACARWRACHAFAGCAGAAPCVMPLASLSVTVRAQPVSSAEAQEIASKIKACVDDGTVPMNSEEKMDAGAIEREVCWFVLFPDSAI